MVGRPLTEVKWVLSKRFLCFIKELLIEVLYEVLSQVVLELPEVKLKNFKKTHFVKQIWTAKSSIPGISDPP